MVLNKIKWLVYRCGALVEKAEEALKEREH